MRDPTRIPEPIRQRLGKVLLRDADPVNLFRITWKNDPKTGLFNDGNWLEFPPELTGIDARIVGVVGKWFPTGSHKVGAGFGCLVPRLVTGPFDPTAQVAVWPSTGNFCRGGAFDCALLGCRSLAILPEEMSRERFEWLRSIGAEIIATPGCESNVKEIHDECWNIRRTRLAGPRDRLAGFASATGSAGTIGAADFLRTRHPSLRVAAVEALHNLKYFTWVEQQGRTVEDLHRLRDPDFRVETYAVADEWDRQIDAFNARVAAG